MAEKLVANKGLLKIPEDIYHFEGPNGEREFLTTLSVKNYITVQFPNAKNQSSEVRSQNSKADQALKLVVLSQNQIVKVRICAVTCLGLTN
jgi:hypothetical protein